MDWIDDVPLSNKIIIKLNALDGIIEDKNNLTDGNIEEIKVLFKEIIDDGDRYEVDEIESWLKNEGSWQNKKVRTRIVNIAHYVQAKYEQTNKFKIISNNTDSCGCEN